MKKAAPKIGDPGVHLVACDQGEEPVLLISCEEDEPVVRKSFRVPLSEGMVTFALNGKSFNALDLSMYGVGIHILDPDEFHIGDIQEKAQIIFSDRSFLVDTEVIHISPREGDTLICGLHIINTHDAGYVDWMTRVIEQMKHAVLTHPKELSK